MPWKILHRKDGYYVVKDEQMPNGRYKAIHSNPHESLDKAEKHLYAIEINYYGYPKSFKKNK